MPHNKKIYIDGMTCVSCELLIKNELEEITEIKEVTVCHKKKIAEITFDRKEGLIENVIDKIKELGYTATLEPAEKAIQEKTTSKQWVYSILVVLGLYIIYRYLNWIGVLGWLKADTSEITYGVAFIVGIVASMSTCLAIVGAVVMSFGAKYEATGNFFERNLKPHLLFHFGRLLTFFVLGGLLGVIGSWINLTPSFMGWFTVLIAVILGWLGLNILGILPSVSTLGLHMPKKFMNTWGKLKTSNHALAPVVLGGFTFFLPCGFTQSMQLFAISSGSFWAGAFTLFLFALGTTPILLGLGVATTKFKNMNTTVLKKAIGFLIIVFAFYTLSTGFALSGINIDFFDKKDVGSITEKNNIQIVKMDATRNGFSPNTFRIKKGIPVKWIINGSEATGCTNRIMMPELNIEEQLTRGDNVIEFTPKKAGTLNFSCWMGMVRGKFIVE